MIQVILDIRDHATRTLDTEYETTAEAQEIIFTALASGARFLPFEDLIVATEDITLIDFIEVDDE